MARVYADVNAMLGPAWYDYGLSMVSEYGRSSLTGLFVESMKIEWNVPDRYEITQRIGGGKYSDVRSQPAQRLPVLKIAFSGIRGHRLVERRCGGDQSAETSGEEKD